HAAELASFKTYGLPAPAVFLPVIGVLEIAGGVALVTGRLMRPAALLLAADMVGAIVVSGIVLGELVSLTVAPAELIAMVVVIGTGPRHHALPKRGLPNRGLPIR